VTDRQEMLDRIRKALGRPLETGYEPPPDQPGPPLGNVMPPLAPEEWLPKFEAELGKVGGSPHRAASFEALEDTIRKVLESTQASSVVLTRNPILTQLKLEERLPAWGISVASWPKTGDAKTVEVETSYREACFSAAAGISGVDFVLAETGSLVLTSQGEGSQLATLAPPLHIALYRASQLVGSLDDVLQKLLPRFGPASPASGRSVVFVTGPSRTADIEQILVRGVHGPRDVHAILVGEACFEASR
jgi:L-lactate dehydrogenase complex protein LldG